MYLTDERDDDILVAVAYIQINVQVAFILFSRSHKIVHALSCIIAIRNAALNGQLAVK